jgi:hypothetical protein
VSQVDPVVSDEAVELDVEDRAWLDERLREYRELLPISTTIEAANACSCGERAIAAIETMSDPVEAAAVLASRLTRAQGFTEGK